MRAYQAGCWWWVLAVLAAGMWRAAPQNAQETLPPAEPQLEKGQHALVGTWETVGRDGRKVRLTLGEDGTYLFAGVQGRYQVRADELVLISEAGRGAFRYRMQGKMLVLNFAGVEVEYVRVESAEAPVPPQNAASEKDEAASPFRRLLSGRRSPALGRWLTRDADGNEVILELRPEGKYTLGRSTGTFLIDRDTLTISHQGTKISFQLLVDGETLVIAGGDLEGPLRFRRLGEPLPGEPEPGEQRTGQGPPEKPAASAGDDKKPDPVDLGPAASLDQMRAANSGRKREITVPPGRVADHLAPPEPLFQGKLSRHVMAGEQFGISYPAHWRVIAAPAVSGRLSFDTGVAGAQVAMICFSAQPEQLNRGIRLLTAEFLEALRQRFERLPLQAAGKTTFFLSRGLPVGQFVLEGPVKKESGEEVTFALYGWVSYGYDRVWVVYLLGEKKTAAELVPGARLVAATALPVAKGRDTVLESQLAGAWKPGEKETPLEISGVRTVGVVLEREGRSRRLISYRGPEGKTRTDLLTGTWRVLRRRLYIMDAEGELCGSITLWENRPLLISFGSCRMLPAGEAAW